MNVPQTAIPRTAHGPKKFHPHYYAVLDWVLVNPHRNDSEGASELGLSPSWFSMIINSDTFQAQLAERARELGVEVGVRGIYGKMLRAADLAMDETVKKLEEGTASEAFVSSTRDNLLKTLGYTKEAAPQASVKNEFHLHAKSLHEARALLDMVGGKVVDVTPVGND